MERASSRPPTYRELVVWQKAMDLAEAVYQLSPQLPREETYGMRSQITRAALPLTYQDLHANRQYRETYGLMTHDSLIVAVMRRERITYLATNDADFGRIPHIAIRNPE